MTTMTTMTAMTTEEENERLYNAALHGYNTIASTAIDGFKFHSMGHVVEHLLCKWGTANHVVKSAYHINRKWLCIKFYDLAPIEQRNAVYRDISKKQDERR